MLLRTGTPTSPSTLIHLALCGERSRRVSSVLSMGNYLTSRPSSSWLNAVEGFFARLSKRRLKRGVFHSVVDLQAAINRFLVEHNKKPKPFTWTADPDKIIAAVKRGHQALDSIH